MFCKICNQDVQEKFYKHVNGHKSSLREYFEIYPEQKDYYYQFEKSQCAWNKGLRKDDHPSVANYASKIKSYRNSLEERKKQSERMKKRYEAGDIVSPEVGKRIVKAGSDGWVRRLANSTPDERRELMSPFTTAGNEAQAARRDSLTPEDYERLYPWAKGKARYYTCYHCSKRMIGWFGGKPRSKKRFCDQNCFNAWRLEGNFPAGTAKSRPYFSTKMNLEFHLASNLEEDIAKLMDNSSGIISWSTTPFCIPYMREGVKRRYYPDFFFNEKYVLEVKSSYTHTLNGEVNALKIAAAQEFCKAQGYEFLYWVFSYKNGQVLDLKNDASIREFLLG